MRKTRVVHVKSEAWILCRAEERAYVGRAGHGEDGYFGNPFRLSAGEPRGTTIERYRHWFLERVRLGADARFRQAVLALKGRMLGCFCVRGVWEPGDSDEELVCHAQVIARWLEATAS